MTTKDKGGRPTIYNKKLALKICERLAHGESLRSICNDEAMPARSTVIAWVYEDKGVEKDDKGQIIQEGFSYHYDKARNIALDIMADDILDIADDGSNDWMEKEFKDGGSAIVLDKEAVMRSRLRVDARKWYLSKMAPKRYGDNKNIMHSGNPDQPVTFVVDTGIYLDSDDANSKD